MKISQACICANINQQAHEILWRREMKKIWKLPVLSAQSLPKHIVNLGQWLLNILNFSTVEGILDILCI